MRKPPETIGASAEVCNPARGWLNLDALPAARGLKKEKLVRRSQKNESGKAAVVPVGVNLKKIHAPFWRVIARPDPVALPRLRRQPEAFGSGGAAERHGKPRRWSS